MSERVTIKIFERDTTLTPSKLRSIGYIPATVYGNGREPVQVQLKSHEFQLAWERGVKNYLLEGVGQSMEAQVKQVQKHNVKDNILHIEFYVPSAGAGKGKHKRQAANQKQEANASLETLPNEQVEDTSRQAFVEEAVVPAH